MQCSLWYCTEWRARSKTFIQDTPLPLFLVFHILAFPFLSCAFTGSLRSCIISIPQDFQNSALQGLGQCNLTTKEGTFWKVSRQEASRSVSQPEVFQVVNSTLRNSWCKPCTIPFPPKTCWQFCFCRNLKYTGFVEGCIVAKPRIFINQNLHRKPVLMDDVPNSVPQSHNLPTHVAGPWTQPWHCWHSSPEKPPPEATTAALSGCSANTYKD